MASISAAGSLSVGKVNYCANVRPKPSRCFSELAMRRIFGRYSNASSSSRICDANVSSSSSAGCRAVLDRREVVLVLSSVGLLAPVLWNSWLKEGVAAASEFADMPAIRGKDYGKTKMRYPDYTETESGLQYKDLRVGSGPTPKVGETVVVDWDGYTIGYYGRIFEARNKTKGGSFEGEDKEFYKFRVGSQQVIPAFEEAIAGMALGGIRRIVVPPELGYPDNDYNKSGPRPTTFSGQRALDFVLRNQGLIDKTLLFDIELLKIIPN
ncbi:hypothetical protein RHGRI_033180 [Rhododendron griersonianum]|uniref:peptidylprolyl isomerase n=1 Tax=Rhododendron griersonianum TaxID=479676 RepID=A0AAV6HYC6_9ERIC|nr:hypothetical protein RHGRI_033180 [Rhododendron griersonianum]